CCQLRCANPQGREASLLARPTVHRGRADHQHEDGETARSDGPDSPPRPRRRDNRMIERREFITLLGGAAVAVSRPRGGWAQQAGMPVVGYLRSAPFVGVEHLVTAFRHGLSDSGFTEGQNVRVEYRSAEGYQSRLASLATELVQRHVNVIFCDNIAALAAKAATTSIPIVFAGGGDAVKEGLVASLNRPGGNVTGVNFFTG